MPLKLFSLPLKAKKGKWGCDKQHVEQVSEYSYFSSLGGKELTFRSNSELEWQIAPFTHLPLLSDWSTPAEESWVKKRVFFLFLFCIGLIFFANSIYCSASIIAFSLLASIFANSLCIHITYNSWLGWRGRGWGGVLHYTLVTMALPSELDPLCNWEFFFFSQKV